MKNTGGGPGGRYRILRVLKDGAGVTTFVAQDEEQEQHPMVVLKRTALSRLTPGLRLRLEHEIEVLRQLRPAMAIIANEAANELYVVLPYVAGTSLEERLMRGPLGVLESLVLAQGALGRLCQLHQQGVLHREVKPANLILHETGATLVDSCLPRSLFSADVPLREQLAQAAQYVSPEQVGLLPLDVDERSDLYSMGLVLYTCLVGAAPFQSPHLGEILQQQLTLVPPSLRATGLAVPRAVDELVMRLIRKDPRDRYQSCEAVLADINDIVEALQRGIDNPLTVPGARDRRRALTEPAFIGRTEELASLSKALQDTRKGDGGLILVEAESGGGKSRLLVELALMQAAGGWLLRGHGIKQAAEQPFQILAGVVAGLARADGHQMSAFCTRLGADTHTIVAALPELKTSLPVATEQPGPVEFGEQRTLRALAHLLDALGTAERPAIVILDDFQWADDVTLRLLKFWQHRATTAACYTMVVLAFRSEEVPADHGLRTLPCSVHLVLAPMSEPEVLQLVESMAGPVPPGVASLVFQLSAGSPFMACAVLHGLVEAGALLPEAGGWRINELALSSMQASHQSALLLGRRLELLSPETRRLLAVGAVLGKTFDISVAALLAQQKPADALLALEVGRRRHLVWTRGEGTQAEFVHDRVRDALLDTLTADERRDLHRRAAEHYQATAPKQVFDLAFHFDAAGDSQRALPYALEAAEAARTRHALSSARNQYRIAQRGATHAAASIQGRIFEGLGDVAMLDGRYEEAETAFAAAAALAVDAVGQARIRGKVGELAFKRGHMRVAAGHLEEALRLLGRWVPRRSAGFAVGCGWEIVVQAAHTLFAPWSLARRPLSSAGPDLVALRLYSRLAYAYWFTRGMLPATWVHLREMNLAERYPPTLELAQAYSEHAPAMTQIGAFKRGLRYVQKSMAIRQALGDLWGQGQTLHFWGVLLYAQARFDECLEKCQEAVRILEQTGDRWEAHTARWNMVYCLYRLGRLDEAVVAARDVLKTAANNQQAVAICLGIWSRASGGMVPAGLVKSARQHAVHDGHTAAELSMAESVRLLREGKSQEATDLLEQAFAQVVARGQRSEYVAPLLPWLLTALRQQRQETPEWDVARRRSLLRRSWHYGRRAMQMARTFPSNLPHAWREMAWLEAASGRPQRALHALVRSLEIAEHQHALAERRQTVEAWDRMARQLGWTEMVEQAVEIDRHPPSTAPTLALADRFDAILEVGREIASSLTREAVFASLRNGALRLLRAERCLVIMGTEGVVAGGDGFDHSASMVEDAHLRGSPVVLSDVGRHTAESLSDVRSALCAPILLRGEAAGCVYVTQRQVVDLFGEDEKRIASFLTTVAGAALENAEGFAALRTLNETLEARVAERTTALEERTVDLERQIQERLQVEAALREAKLAAEAANRAKSYFLANVSHEIRTPVNGIVGFTDLALDTALDDAQREFLTTVKSCAQALLNVINDMIDLSRIEAGKLDLNPIEFNLRSDLNDIVRRLSLRAREKGLQLNCVVETAVPDVLLGDAYRLGQVLSNLIGNAIKFTDAGKVEVLVSTVSTTARLGEVWLKFRVRDSGIGIAGDKLASIFDPFVQIDSSLSRRQGGVGLGLAIASRLVERMGGRISIDSKPEQGSTFEFTACFDTPSDADRAEALPPATGPAPKRLRLLVVDDDPVSLNYIVHLLRREGHEVCAAEDGRAALEAVARGPFAAILMDINMPELDGFDTLRAIRSLEGATTIPVIAITARAMLGDRELCLEAGMDAYLPKPVSQRDLLETLRTLIAKQEVSTSSWG